MDNDLVKKLELKIMEVRFSILDRIQEAIDDNDLELIDLLAHVYSSL